MSSNENYSKAYSEVYEILRLASKELRDKIPRDFMNLIKREKDDSYKPCISSDIPLEKQHLMEETLNILTVLKLNCWCNENERKELLKLLNENEKKYQNELRKKYGKNEIFKTNDKSIDTNINYNDDYEKDEKDEKNEKQNEKNQLIPAQKKEKWYIKLFKKIRGLFKRNKK